MILQFSNGPAILDIAQHSTIKTYSQFKFLQKELHSMERREEGEIMGEKKEERTRKKLLNPYFVIRS